VNKDAKPDDLQSTGELKALAAGSELYAEWLARMQRGRGRQATLSKNLYTWANYKNWSDKVRNSWESDAVPAEKKGK
jgi:hypothetical protein